MSSYLLLADKALTLISSPNQNNSSRTYKTDLNAFLFATIIAQLLLNYCIKKKSIKKENEAFFFWSFKIWQERYCSWAKCCDSLQRLTLTTPLEEVSDGIFPLPSVLGRIRKPQTKTLRPGQQIRHPEAESKSEQGIKNMSDGDTGCHKPTCEAC